MKNNRGKGAIEKGSANWQFAPLPLSDIDRSSSDARKGLGLTEGSLIERRKLPVCATVAETIFPFHYAPICGFRLFTCAAFRRKCVSKQLAPHICNFNF